MKKLIYVTYLALLLVILLACQKEQVIPQSTKEIPAEVDKARIGHCKPYFYIGKKNVVRLGTARGDYVLVGFDPVLMPADKQLILANYSIYDGLDGESYFDSGIITVVKLKPGVTCFAVDNFIKSLNTRQAVRFAYPIFDPQPGTGDIAWIGLTNEFFVTLTDANAYPLLKRLSMLTRTSIVSNLDDVTYILSADKNSVGNTLEMCSLFNRSPAVVVAEPNFLFQSASFGSFRKSQDFISQARPNSGI